MSITDTPYRAPGVLAAEFATVDHLCNGWLNVGVGAGWMPEEFAAASASHIFPKRHTHVRATLESCKASGPTRSSSTTASSPTSARAGSGSSRCRSRIRRSTSPA
uniref:LLM class flavin-dependent oxidoreductase n=1 Tax=Nostocoides jenkinsii TaxID=330834 RepID=UPI00191658B9